MNISDLSKLRVDQLKIKSQRLGGRVSLNKSELIREILHYNALGIKEVEYDINQQAIIASDSAIVFGAPGCGKTTTIAGLIKDEKTIVLVYNKVSKHILENNIKRFNIKCNIYTLYEFIHMIKTNTKKLEESEEDEELYDVNMAIDDIKMHLTFDRFILDEAQDFNDSYEKIIKTVIACSKSYFIFGDPRQYLFTRATWFRNMTPTHHLNINYRSAPEIIQYLNEFSKKSFGDLHHDMISPVDNNITGSIDIIKNVSTQELAKILKKDSLYPTLYIVFAKSTEHNAIKELCHELYKISPLQHISILDGEINVLKSHTVIGTTKQIKGTECDIVVYINCDAPPTFTFTSLSRAKKRIIHVETLTYSGYNPSNLYELTRKIDRTIDMYGVLYDNIPIINTSLYAKCEKIAPYNLLMSIDIETFNVNILEICAVVYDVKQKKIIDYYKTIAEGVEEFESNYVGPFIFNSHSNSTGLNCKNFAKIARNQKILIENFAKFAAKYSNFAALQYAGNDTVKLGLSCPVINVYNIFKDWNTANNINRAHELSLMHMVRDIYGYYFPFMHHRAMEDAVMTLYCYLSLSILSETFQ